MRAKKTRQFVIYSRKSKFTGKGESVENQVEMCRQYIARTYSPEEAETALVYEDEGFSGGNLERPQFKKMMRDSHRKKFAAIVVYRLDRISRNIGDFAGLIQDLGDRQINFISIRELFDTASPMGRAMMYIASVFSQLERETIAERIRDNLRELAKTGRWLGGNTPLGYESESVTSVSVDGKTRKAYKLKAIPEETALVKKIFEVFVESGSLCKVDQYLLEKQIKTRRGNDFSRYAIRSILTNPVYMIADEQAYAYLMEEQVDLFSPKSEFDGTRGVMAYNRTLQRPGKTNQINPMTDWIVAVGQHTGIIPGSLWTSVQKKLEMNKVKAYHAPRANCALLSGLLICGNCGDYMRPKVTGRMNAKGQAVFHYLCTKKERSHGKICNIKNPNGNTLDAKVMEEVKQCGQQGDVLAGMILKTKKIMEENLDGRSAERNQVRSQLEENNAAIKKLVVTLSNSVGTTAEPYIREQIEERDRLRQGLQKRLTEFEAEMSENVLAQTEVEIMAQMLANIGSCIDDYTPDEKRAAIRAIVQKVVWDGENVHIYIFGQDGEPEFPENREEISN